MVGGRPIPESDYAHWYAIAAKTGGGGDPDAVEQASLRDQVLEFLILERWVAGDAANAGVAPSPAVLQRAFTKAKRDSYPKDAGFETFLTDAGMTASDAFFQTSFNTVYSLLRARAALRAAPVTRAQVAAFYALNRSKLDKPHTRDLRVVLTRTKPAALTAKAALQRGRTWGSVARAYSIDPATRDTAGRLRGLVRGQQEPSFDDAIFSAPIGKLRGPVVTQFGYYLFEVVQDSPTMKQTLAQAAQAIGKQLRAQNLQKADDAYNTALRTRWRAVTLCAEGYVTKQCSNGPDS